MKRTIHIIFWLSLLTALAVFLFRRGERQQETKEAQESSSSAELRAPALARVPPPALVTPDGGSAPTAEPEDPEAAVAREIRNIVRDNPAKAVELARAARERYGDSRYSDDRDGFLVQGYYLLHDMAAARAEMPYYYKHHPHGRWGNYLFALTNVGPNSPP